MLALVQWYAYGAPKFSYSLHLLANQRLFDTYMHTQTERHTDRQRDTDTHRGTHRDTETPRETHPETHTQRQTEREREYACMCM